MIDLGKCESPQSVAEFSEILTDAAKRRQPRTIRGAASKIVVPATAADVFITTQAYTGIVDHQASDFTITARAGTPIREVIATLASVGQCLPFDPTYANHNATVGGLVATGLNGPCRLRYGGIRDFVIGCQHVDGVGNIVRSGGKVVKNAAGFDIPKLMVGSGGKLGLITEVTFKVFPAAQCFRTFLFPTSNFQDTVSLIQRLVSIYEFEAIEILEDNAVVTRIAGSTTNQLEAVSHHIAESLHTPLEIVDDESTFWTELSNAELPSDTWLVKVPIDRKRIIALDGAISDLHQSRRYTAGGHSCLASIDSETALASLASILNQQNLTGQVVVGNSNRYLLGRAGEIPFLQRIKSAMDPHNIFGAIDVLTGASAP